MSTTPSTVAGAFLDAILARDLARASGLLHDQINFRAMTPNRIWEAEGPSGVEDVLGQWLRDPDEEIESVTAVEPGGAIEDTERIGWLVHGSGADGPFVYEQQAYLRERDGQIGWLRVMCSGQRPTTGR
jgi:hypothetical protein